jgi:hypothetical protein
MGSLEKLPTRETILPQEIAVPNEVQEMDKSLISEAKVIFQDNHELVKEAMFGMGSRKAKEVMQQLSECRGIIKEVVMKARSEKKKIYSAHQ